MDTLRVERETVTLHALVVEKLRDAITEGVFRPGERLVERDICERLDVSRPSVREAIRRLEAEGLVKVVPHRGPLVRELTAIEAAELYDIQSVLEGQCARYCALRATEADLDHMKTCTSNLVGALLARDTQAIIRTKKIYYDAFLAACHSQDLQNYMRQIAARLSQFWSTSVNVPGRVEEGAAELREILRAIGCRDPDAAFVAGMTFIQHARRPHALRAGLADETAPRPTAAKAAKPKLEAGQPVAVRQRTWK